MPCEKEACIPSIKIPSYYLYHKDQESRVRFFLCTTLFFLPPRPIFFLTRLLPSYECALLWQFGHRSCILLGLLLFLMWWRIGLTLMLRKLLPQLAQRPFCLLRMISRVDFFTGFRQFSSPQNHEVIQFNPFVCISASS
jgi:hypothetical protein